MEEHRQQLPYQHLEEFISQGGTFNVSVRKIISRAWEMLTLDLPTHIGFDFLFGIIYGIASQILSFIAYILVPPFHAGWYIHTYRKKRGLSADFNTLFKGFGHMGNLIIYGLINVLFQIIALLPFIGLIIYSIYYLFEITNTNNPQGIDPFGDLFEDMNFLLFTIIGSTIFVICNIIFNIYFFFAPFFIVFSDLSASEAIKKSATIGQRNFMGLLKITIVFSFIQLIGSLLCLVGRLITTPLSHISYHLIFEEIFDLDKGLSETDEIIQHLI